MAASLGVVTPRVQTINNGPLATCTGHLPAGEAIKFSENRWVETEKAQMAEIRAARGQVKASLTRLENTFDEINTRNEISIRLSRLKELLKELERLDSTLSLEESELQEFEERYFNLNATFF
ncbi:hypothetical protein TNCV_4222371 [Trichonephila clavipes]|nr:hypothetical protein TNCV_4222371 [Trichonephila clavipes]